MRLLFTCVSGQSHFYNTVPLAFAARDRGHEVAYSSAHELGPVVNAAGLTLLPAGPGRLRLRAELTRDPQEHGEPGVEDWSAGARMFGYLAPSLRWRPLSEVVDRYRPDAIVSEVLELVGPLVAMRHGIPHFSLSIGPYYPETMEQLWTHAEPLYREILGTAVTHGDVLGRYIDVIPPELQSEEGLRLPERLLAGTRLYHGQNLAEPPEKRSPTSNAQILMTFGTVSNRAIHGLRESAARLSRRGLDVLITTGPDGWFDWRTDANTDTGADGARTAGGGTVRVVDYAPLDRELPHTSVLIHHGGSNTMRAAVDAGVPSLVIPQQAEQARNARWALEHGLSLVLEPSQADPDAVEAAVLRLLEDDEVRARLAAARAAFEGLPSAETAIDELERACLSARPRAEAVEQR